MKIEVTENDNQIEIALDGMLDSNTSAQFQETIDEIFLNEHLNMILNLEKLSYTSSQGIRTFLSIMKKNAAQNGKLIFKNIQPAVMEVFDMSGLSQMMQIE